MFESVYCASVHPSWFPSSSTVSWVQHRCIWSHCDQCGHVLTTVLCWSSCLQVPLVWMLKVVCDPTLQHSILLGQWSSHCRLNDLSRYRGEVDEAFHQILAFPYLGAQQGYCVGCYRLIYISIMGFSYLVDNHLIYCVTGCFQDLLEGEVPKLIAS